jgi:hypothetical protein
VTTSFTRTRTQIAQRVLGQVIKIGAQTASSADADTVYEAIDLRLKSMHKLGTFWRKVTSTPVTFSLSSSVVSASAGAGDILFPMKVTFTDGSLDEPVTIIGPREYAAIEDKGRIGTPEKAIWKGGSEFWFYPVPGSDGTAKLLYEKIADDTSLGAAVDVDVAMILPLMKLIRYDIADDFGVDEVTQNRWMKEAERAERDIQKLAAPRIEYAAVLVDDYDATVSRETDY